MNDVYTTMLQRTPKSATNEEINVIQATIACGKNHAESIAKISKRDDLSPKGRLDLVQTAVRQTGAAYQKSQDMIKKHAGQIENMKIAARKKAAGEELPTDAEFRSMLRAMSLADRIAKVMNDPAARGAALRQPGLSEIPSEHIEDLMEIALKENAADDMTKVAEFEGAHEIMVAALHVAQSELLQTAFLSDQTGNPRRPMAEHELAGFLSKTS